MKKDDVTLRDLVTMLQTRWIFILCFTAGVFLLGLILNFFILPEIYEAEVILRVDLVAPKEAEYGGIQGEGIEGKINTISRLPEMTINTYVGQLQSNAVIDRVIKRLKLNNRGINTRRLREMVSITAVRDSNLLEIRATNADPKLAAQVANTIAAQFLDLLSEKNEEQMGKTIEFLKKQIVINDEELQKAMVNLNNLQSRYGEINLINQQIGAKNAYLISQQSQLVLANKELAVLKPGSTAAGQRAEQVKQLQGVVSRTSGEVQALQSELAKKQTMLDMAKKEVQRIQDTGALLRAKIDETRIGKALRFGETSLVMVSPAGVPDTPVRPRKMLNSGVAFITGLAASVGLVFFRDQLDTSFNSPEEVEAVLGVEVLGQIPFLDRKRQLKEAAHESSLTV